MTIEPGRDSSASRDGDAVGASRTTSPGAGRWLVWIGLVVAVLTVIAVGCVAIGSMWSGPVPSMSLVPSLPDDAEIVRNETEYSDGAGGFGARVLVLTSASRSPEQLAADVTRSFDGDSLWRKESGWSDGRRWQREPVPCDPTGSSPRTSASVGVASPGETVDVGQFQTFVVGQPSVLVHLSTLHHSFCNVGTAVR